MLQDLRYAARNLLKARGFTAVAAATLAIGVGANTAIFSVIDTILLRPLPYRNPDQLVRLYETEAAPGKYPFAAPDYLDWKAQNHTFQDMTLYGWPGDMNLSDEGRADHVRVVATEANFFALLGVSPLLGRTWIAGEDQPGRNRVLILSYGLWQGRFAGDPGVIGRTVALDSRNYTVVGVMPAHFRYPSPQTQAWVPQAMDAQSLYLRGSHNWNAVGRLKPGTTLKAARADLTVIAARLEKAYPDSNDKVGAVVVPLRDDLVGNSRGSLLAMLAAVGVVLLIACANVANLLLSRAVARQREMAVRSALGAGRWRLVRQLLTESLALACLGGVLGLVLAWGVIGLFARLKGFALPQFNVVRLNSSVLAFAFALAAVTGVLFGIVPALQASRPDLHEELKGGGGSSVSPGRQRRLASNILVAGEIALSLVLLVCGGLLLQDFVRLRGKDIGVRAEGVWTGAVRLPETRYEIEQQQFSFAQALLEKAAHIPGVDSAALTDHLPLEGGRNGYIRLRGQTPAAMSAQLVEMHGVSPDYFRTLGVPLLRGRVFRPEDVQRALAVGARLRPYRESGRQPSPELTNSIVYPVVINQSMAKFFWPNQDPIGQMFSGGGNNGPWRQVVGVVGDVPEWGLASKVVPESYYAFSGDSRLFLVLHTSGRPSALEPEARRVLARLDSSLPLFSTRTMDEVIADHAQGQQFLSLLVGSFAAIAVLLAAIGIYGVLSYAVTQRTREIGIRISLGAGRARVLVQVLVEGMRLALLGLAAGLAGALAAGRILASLLHEVKPGEPAIFVVTTGLLAAVALLACYLPARRAARLNPIAALRYE